MRQFLLTNESKFNGAIQIAYNSQDILESVDMRESDLSVAQRKYAMQHIPIQREDLRIENFGEKAMLVEKGYVIVFEDFWKKYPNKVNKKRCQALWEKMNTEKRYKAIEGLQTYLLHLKYNQWKVAKDPDTYLRNENWEDEYR